MGHISAKVAQKLIKNGLATGLRLETTASGEPFFASPVFMPNQLENISRKSEVATGQLYLVGKLILMFGDWLQLNLKVADVTTSLSQTISHD